MITVVMSFLGSKIGKLLASVAGILAAVLAVFAAGARSNKKSTEVKNLKGYIKAQERVNEVEVSTDRDAATKRLRDNNQLRD